LSDTHSGISTSPLIIRKVDKGKVMLEEGGPVSQMQKIALQRVNPDGSRHYLSAAGPLPGTPGVIAPPAPGMSSQAGTHPLLFHVFAKKSRMAIASFAMKSMIISVGLLLVFVCPHMFRLFPIRLTDFVASEIPIYIL
jgi:hypothetical protein